MIDVRLLKEVWLPVLALSLFSLLVRPIACGIALMLVGVPPSQARRGGLLLTPLGEFTFIIAQAGIASAILPVSFYPLSVGLSVLTVLATPILNRFAGPILRFLDAIEPAPVSRFIAAYQSWLHHVANRDAAPLAWKLIRSRLVQVAVEILFVAGVLIFSNPLLLRLEETMLASMLGINPLRIAYWIGIGLLVLIPLFAAWRNIGALAAIVAEAWHMPTLTPRFIRTSLRTAAAVALGSFLYALFPVRLSPLGWLFLGIAAIAVVTVFSRKLIYWHSTWQHSMNTVLAGQDTSTASDSGANRESLAQGLEAWDLQLHDFTVPPGAGYAGSSLADLQIPSRFGCFVVEVERNDFVIPHPSPDLSCFPGDKLLLLGVPSQIEKALEFLSGAGEEKHHQGDFDRAVLDSFIVPDDGPTGVPLGRLQIARKTGVRVLGIGRNGSQILVPQATEVLKPGDRLLGLGSLDQLRDFRNWLESAHSGN
ncbi:MAG: sodium:proton exchanger, partial [Opitutaceae bacterium]|nr:sodium:proton exchanger [Opitutaceae bacterium]